MMKKLIILCGPSGTGKTTIQEYLMKHYNIPKVLTHTTREMRPGEREGVDYYFETPASFSKKHYFESVQYDGKQYGSSREALMKAWDESSLASLVVDTAGAIQYVKSLGNQVDVWHIEVSNPQALKARLIKRGDDPLLINQRINSFESQRDFAVPVEICHNTHIVVNDNWETTVKTIQHLIQNDR